MNTQTVDPITLQVISGALKTIAEEMGHVLYRMSFSSIIRESQDMGAGLFDTRYQTICESESTPMHIGSIPAYLRGIEATLQGGAWHEGDVVVHNHPYHGSSHSPDLAVIVPVFHEGELVGFAGNTAHHIDIGAATPGLIIDVGDVYAEGMLMAGLKLYERGVRNEALVQMFRYNSRAADQLIRDIEAQVASAQLRCTALQRAAGPLRQGLLLYRDQPTDRLRRDHHAPADRADPRRRLPRRRLPRRRWP